MTLPYAPAKIHHRSHATAEVRVSTSTARLQDLLDRTSAQLAVTDISGMDDFALELDYLRRSISPALWWQLIADVIRPHPILAQLHEEPFTRRAFEKPRGYPGDAPLLDLVYRARPYMVELTRLGAALHAWADGGAGCRSVQERRFILANAIDAAAERRDGARVLSLACGHLREAQLSEAVRRRAVSEFIALDQDTESLAVVEREQRDSNVIAKRASVRRFVASGGAFGEFDLAYTAGLYDYLTDEDTAAVTRTLFQSLRRGGRMLIANFAPELPDIAFMDAVMDWRLIYRNEDAVLQLATVIPSESIAKQSIARDQAGNVVYLTIDKV